MKTPAIPEGLTQRYEVCYRTIPIGRWADLSVLAVSDPDSLIDTLDPEAFREDERLPYWAEIWASAVGLGIHFFEHPITPGETILELGCGVGVAGIAGARAGLLVDACDYEPDALAFAAYNAVLNAVESRMTFLKLDWRKPSLTREYAVIAGSDVIYEKPNHAPIADLVDAVLAPEGTALFSDPNRRGATEFVELMAARGYQHTSQLRQIKFDGENQAISVHRFRKEGRRTKKV